MKEFELTEDFIIFKDEVGSWEKAIIESAQPLLLKNYITDEYITAMIDSINENGPYICIAPNVAMPHARPETGSKKVGFSILKLNKAVAFSESKNHHSKLLITLSCKESDIHVKMLQNIVKVLSINDNLDKILETENKETVINIFEGGNNE